MYQLKCLSNGFLMMWKHFYFPTLECFNQSLKTNNSWYFHRSDSLLYCSEIAQLISVYVNMGLHWPHLSFKTLIPFFLSACFSMSWQFLRVNLIHSEVFNYRIFPEFFFLRPCAWMLSHLKNNCFERNLQGLRLYPPVYCEPHAGVHSSINEWKGGQRDGGHIWLAPMEEKRMLR